MRTTPHVVIVGAGIAGLTAGIALQKIGWRVTICERSPMLGEVGAGISLWANAIAALDHLGAGDAVRAVARRCETGAFRNASGSTLLRVPYREYEERMALPPTVWMLHREALIRVLADRLGACQIKFGRTLVQIDEAESKVHATFECESTEECDALIGADGIRSAVRRSIFGDESVRYAGYTCWRGVAQVPAELHDPRELVEIWGAGRRFGITPLPGERVYWFAVSDEAQGGIDRDAKAAVRERFGDWAAPVPELINATPSQAIIRHDIIDRPPRRQWHQGRTVLVGDAAHPTTPNLGQGGCMAIEDSVVLATCIARAADVPSALGTFVDTRRSRTARITQRSWSIGRFAQGSNAITRLLRNGLTRLTPPNLAFRSLAELARFDPGPLPSGLRREPA